MKKKPEWLKKIGNLTQKASNSTAHVFSDFGKKASEHAKALDNEYDISGNIQVATKNYKEFISDVNKKYLLHEKAEIVGNEISKARQQFTSVVDETGLVEKINNTKDSLNEKLLVPVSGYYFESGTQERLGNTLDSLEATYGEIRSRIKPYYAPETPIELLESTKEELIYINSCILQISADEAEKLANKLGAAVASKVAGAATVGVLFSMVSTFGSAGTGTAIASLSGAAASNATLAWVGGLLGGGMATGAVLTGGVALAAGVGVYRLLSSEARQFEQLSEQEQRIVESTGFLIATINDILQNSSIHLDAVEAEILLNNTLKPLYQSLLDTSEEITKNLDKKHSLLYRQHALVDFNKRVLHGFEYFINSADRSKNIYPEFVIAGVIYALLTRTAVDDSIESQLGLLAIKRMKNEWHDASESQLSDYLASYEPEQLKGIANNVKGIYHEILFVEQYNKQNSDTYAALFAETNHPGADVQIFSKYNDQVLCEFQLKASDSSDYINNHFEKYPEIDVLATDELACKIDNVSSSGISNSAITENIDQILDQISNNTLTDRAFDSMAFASLATAGKESINLIRGKGEITDSGMKVVKTATVASASTLIASYLFS